VPIIATGSGVIISPDGYIVTNNHVVQETARLEVTLNDNRTFEAELIGNDPSTDLALIKIDGENLPYLNYGNSDDLKVGEWVLAVGNPFNLTSTVTAGIVSAKARNINILGSNTAIESFIQTDAAVNRGNSGGALVNTNGELVGINAAIASNTGNYTGYSFAIPVNIVKKVMDDFMNYGGVQRAYLGITFTEIDSEFAKQRGLDEVKGVYVADVLENSAAEKGGIKPGDVIVKIDNSVIDSKSSFLESIGTHRPGDKVDIQVMRNGKPEHIEVTLTNSDGNTNIIKNNDIRIFGASFKPVTEEDMYYLRIDHGIKVADVAGGKFRDAGIRKGFIILSIDRKPVYSVDDLKREIEGKRGGILIEGVYPNGRSAYYGIGL
jgi:Do/DeqQ family serine protease